MTDTPKKPIYQKCKFCGNDFGTRGIRNHETACARRTAADPPQEPAEPPEPPQDPAETEIIPEETEEPGPQQTAPLKLIPLGKVAEATEMAEETIKTATGNTIKIIKDIAAPNSEAGIKSAGSSMMSDIANQAKMIGDLNGLVKSDGMQHALNGLGSFLEAGAEKLRGGVSKAAGTAGNEQTHETEEQKFLRLFEQGLV